YAWNQEGNPSAPFSFGGTFNITSGAGANANPQSTTGAPLVSGVDYTSSTIDASAGGKASVVYANLPANDAGQITGTYRNIFNGLQLLGPTGSVPEPASLSLLGIAAIAGLMRRRSVRKSTRLAGQMRVTSRYAIGVVGSVSLGASVQAVPVSVGNAGF